MLLLAAGVAAHAQSLLLLSPNGGEQWLGASQQVISWTYSNVDNIDIQYSGDNGLTWTNIIEDYPSSALDYTWTVPAIGNNQSLIRIISALSFTEDQSDGVFTIPEPTIELIYPTTDSFESSTIQYVEWITSGIGQVVLQYSNNNGQNWTDISTSPAEHNYANWTVPSATGEVLLRIYNIEDIAKQDMSSTISIVQSNLDNPTKYAGSPWDGYDMSTSLPSTITLAAPNGGEELEPYSTFMIEWSYVDVTWVDIAYSINNGGTWTTIASQVAADVLSFPWIVPNTPSTQCLVRVSASPEGVQDISNTTFTINPAGLVLTYPNAGQSYDAGTIQYIEWDYNGVASVLAEYSVDGGESWISIGISPSVDRYINWIVPSAVGTDIVLRLSDVDVPSTTDVCDIPLPCLQPWADNPTKYLGSPWDGYSMNDNRPDTLEITSPNGGEVWMSSSVQPITWTYNNVDQVTLEYTIDDGDTWTVINNDVPASQLVYNWTIPTTPSNLCRVRILENTRPNITDLSDDAFIIPTGYVQITYPNGGESFRTGTIQYIEWQQEGLATVKLEYSIDAGASWIVIGTSPAADRYMNWYTPATASANCLIRITDLDNETVFNDQSNQSFAVTIAPSDNPTKYAGSPYDGYSMYAFLDEYVKVIKPNGGEFWGNGTTQQIKWLVLNNEEHLKIELTTDGEANWTALLNDIPNSPPTYNWNIIASPSTICKVRATTLSGEETDKSDYFFTIANVSGIETNSIVGNSFCSDDSVEVGFVIETTFNEDNQFIVQLSDSLGMFNGPVENIGSIFSSTPAPIMATIPVRYYTSDLYRLRVIATSPPTIGTDNGMNFTINPLPAVDLGNDIALCIGDIRELDATNSDATYVWNTGASTPSIFVEDEGQYSVTVTNTCGSSSDTVSVELITVPIVDLGPNVQICQNNVVVLDADSNAVAYQWSTGAITSSIIVSLPGNYSVAATNECGTTTDQINVSLIPIPEFDLGSNFGICPGESVLLEIDIPGTTYVWSNGSSSGTILVSYPGVYWVNATTPCGIISDQIVAFDGSIDLNAGDDVQLCEGATAAIMATGGNSYDWSNGLTGSIIEVSPSQTTSYTVETTNVYNCNASDEVIVFVNANPLTPEISLNGPVIYCSDNLSMLSASEQDNVEYQWLRNGIVQVGENYPQIMPVQTGSYSVVANGINGCSATSEEIQITVNPTYDETLTLIADNGTAVFEGESLTAGIYYYIYSSISGCDSTLTVQVVDLDIVGCTIDFACNYNPLAGTEDNASCEFPDCMDSLACNYNALATCGEMSWCFYPILFFDCDGNCITDTDTDGICDELEIFGCLDPLACNYDILATEEDSNCIYSEPSYDCFGNCLNDDDADGVCDEFEIPGCNDFFACNFDSFATNDDGSCFYAELFYDCEGNCLLDGNANGICDELEFIGCTDYFACNYDSSALTDDGSCFYPELFYDCEGNCLLDANTNGICDELEFIGCTDYFACNYDSLALSDDGSCYYAELYFDCEGNCLSDENGNGICDEIEIWGCTDFSACNYDISATYDDSSCLFPGCTDMLACNFDEMAGCEDGSCVYLPTYAITGGIAVFADSIVSYSYPDNLESNVYWYAFGGEIIGNLDSSVVLVQWYGEGIGQICVIEFQDSCTSLPVCLEVVISDPSSIAEWNDGDWLIYPNPSKGLFRLVTRDLSLRSYEVLDAFGKVVHSGSLQSISTEVDLTSLAAGHYIVKCGTLHKRIVIVR